MKLSSFLLIVLLLFSGATFVHALEESAAETNNFDVDDPFANASDVLVPVETAPIDEAGQAKLNLEVELKARMAGTAGYQSLEVFQNSMGHPYYAAYYELSAQVVADSRPDDYIRVHGDFTAAIPDNGYIAWSEPQVHELWLDYRLMDLAYLRLGTFPSPWGQGQLFNPGNLAAASSEGLDARLTIPLDIGTVTTLVYTTNALFADNPEPSSDIDKIALFGSWELTTPTLTFGIAGHRQSLEEAKASFYIKGSALGLDLALEGISRFAGTSFVPQVLATVFYEGFDRNVLLQIEGLWSKDWQLSDDISVGIGLKLNNIPLAGWEPALTWKHSFRDQGGQVLFGAVGSIAPHMSLIGGVGIAYGPEEGLYSHIPEDPAGRRMFGILALEIGETLRAGLGLQ